MSTATKVYEPALGIRYEDQDTSSAQRISVQRKQTDGTWDEIYALTGTSIVGVAPVEVVTAANTITAAESGTTFFLNSATAFASTLPAPAAGLHYKFVVGATPPSGGNHTVVTNGNATIIQGSVEVAGAVVLGSDEDTISFVDGGNKGDWAYVISDGTNWYVSGMASASGKLTLTDAA